MTTPALKAVTQPTSATPAELSPREVRESADMTQEEMAEVLNMSLFGYQSWEAGRRRPGGPARQMLKLIEDDPEHVKRVVA